MLGLLLALSVGATPSTGAREVLVRHQCNRCHEVEGVAAAPVDQSCSGCHRDIASAAGDPVKMRHGHREFGRNWDGMVARTAEHYCNIPPLAGMARFRAAWLRDYLRAPYDLRPNLTESMIRPNLTEAEIETLVSGWAAEGEPAAVARPAPDRLARGAALFEEKSCALCHLFGNRPFASAQSLQFELQPSWAVRAMAPDLRHARDRLSRSTVEAWIRDPQALLPATHMPKPDVTAAEASLLADFIYFGEPGSPVALAQRAPPTFDPSAPVPTFEEVDAKVFKVVCWHCHEDPELSGGDGGPGNSGGFGFPARGLSFGSYREILAGSFGPNGERQSIFRLGETGEPVLLERLRQRYVEHAWDFVLPGQDDLGNRRSTNERPRPRGMPLGLPALTDEQFSLVERWVRGGHPGPHAGERAAMRSPMAPRKRR